MKEDVERLFWMFGFDDHRKYVSLRIDANNEIKIRRYTYLAQEHQREDEIYDILVTRNNEPAIDIQLYAMAISASEDSPVYQQIIEMTNDGEGHYSIPEIEGNQETEYVVFTDNRNTNKRMLPYYLNTKRSLTIEERNQNKRNTINRIHDLLKNDENEWNKVWFYMKTAIQYKLPYSHCFQALANDPFLLASLIVRLSSSSLINDFGEDTVIHELMRMENDLSYGFHY